MKNIFITGSTGFLASSLLKLVLSKEKNKVYILIRAKDGKSVLKRKNELVERLFSKSIRSKAASRINIVTGNISQDKLGLMKKDL